VSSLWSLCAASAAVAVAAATVDKSVKQILHVRAIRVRASCRRDLRMRVWWRAASLSQKASRALRASPISLRG
jgi:hypothetical protein